jgi:hypothetical protein
MKRCAADRFKNQTEYTSVIGLSSYYFCGEQTDFELYGNFASWESGYVKFYIDVCDQEDLDENYPGQTCKTDEEVSEFLERT